MRIMTVLRGKDYDLALLYTANSRADWWRRHDRGCCLKSPSRRNPWFLIQESGFFVGKAYALLWYFNAEGLFFL